MLDLNNYSTTILVTACISIIFIYFIPSLIAFLRRHSNRWSIFLLNILLGFTFVGWAVALVWSTMHFNREPTSSLGRTVSLYTNEGFNKFRTARLVIGHCLGILFFTLFTGLGLYLFIMAVRSEQLVPNTFNFYLTLAIGIPWILTCIAIAVHIMHRIRVLLNTLVGKIILHEKGIRLCWPTSECKIHFDEISDFKFSDEGVLIMKLKNDDAILWTTKIESSDDLELRLKNSLA